VPSQELVEQAEESSEQQEHETQFGS